MSTFMRLLNTFDVMWEVKVMLLSLLNTNCITGGETDYNHCIDCNRIYMNKKKVELN